MYLICVDNSGFEDMLSEGHSYYAVDIGANGYKVNTDEGVERWLGDLHFAIVIPE